MPLASYAIPFGLRQVRIVPLNDAGVEVPGSAVFLPASRTFSFAEQEDFETLDGDDRKVASHGAGPTVNWELEGGGISLEAWKLLGGGTVGSTGVTPNVIKTFTKLTTDARPYFNVYGRAISDNGGDFEAIVYRCKADGDLEGSMENGSFLLTAASGTGFGNETDSKLYMFRHKETAAPLVNPSVKIGWTLSLSGSPTAGNYRLLINGYSTADIAWNATFTAIQTAINGLSALTGVTATVSGTSPTFTITLSAAGTVEMGTITVTPGTVSVA
jgi:hypothetical protein